MVQYRSHASSAFVVLLAMGFAGSSGAMAADVAMPAKVTARPAPIVDAWTYSITPYAWATSLNGSTTILGRTTYIDASFFDILEHTQFPKRLFQVASFAEARNGRLGILADIAYMKIGVDGGVTRSAGSDALNGLVGISAGITVQMVIAEMAVAYEVARWGTDNSPNSGTALDVYGGGRLWWQRGDAYLSVTGTVNIGGLTLNPNNTYTASGRVSWLDPLIGLRLRHQFAPGVDFALSGDIGGFGAGSKFSWQALAALNYEFSKSDTVSWSGMIGYKALSVDYSHGSGLTLYRYDMTMHGPIFGITARF